LTKEKWRLSHIPTELKKIDADVIAVQEAFSRPSFDVGLIEGYHAPLLGPGRKLFRPANSGLMIISKHPILATRGMNFERAVASDRLASKGTLWARIQTSPGIEIDLFNTHLNNAGPENLRIHQIRQTKIFINEIQKAHGIRPSIYLGDFNSNPEQEAYQFLRNHTSWKDTFEETPRSALQEVAEHLQKGYTWDGERNRHARESEGLLRERIDLILTQDCSNGTLHTLKSGLGMEKEFENGPLSDHYLYWADLQLEAERLRNAST
jgi:endonuclease/exonuclease/phosphatase family metal-dependent hydrolase